MSHTLSESGNATFHRKAANGPMQTTPLVRISFSNAMGYLRVRKTYLEIGMRHLT